MNRYLVFTLYGPLASWGEIAVGETRDSAPYPTRSALIGLLGAACGVERTDRARQEALQAGYRFGVEVVSSGAPLRDYHTTQRGTPGRGQVFRTRRDELDNARKVEAVLSARTYRVEALYRVAVEAGDYAPMALDELAAALIKPQYVLYLGRKSCPPALPLTPIVVDAPNLLAAFTGAAAVAPSSPIRLSWATSVHFYAWEDGMESGVSVTGSHWRYDEPRSRDRWQFARRREWTGRISDEGHHE